MTDRPRHHTADGNPWPYTAPMTFPHAMEDYRLPPDVEPMEPAMPTSDYLPPDGPNRSLPPLSPLKARSTIAAALVIAATVLPLLSPDLQAMFGEAVSEEGQRRILDGTDTAVALLNELVIIMASVWFYLERRAPWRRLSFKGH